MATERILVVGEVVMVRWIDMTVESIGRVDAAVDAARAMGPVTYIGLVGNESSMPSEEARKKLSDGLERMADHCKSISLILDGTGLKFSAMRSAAAALFLIKGTRRMKMFNSLQDCLVDRVPAHAEALMQQARANSIIP